VKRDQFTGIELITVFSLKRLYRVSDQQYRTSKERDVASRRYQRKGPLMAHKEKTQGQERRGMQQHETSGDFSGEGP